jgi:hypothetical protein
MTVSFSDIGQTHIVVFFFFFNQSIHTEKDGKLSH